MNQVYDPMAFAKIRAEQKMQAGQTAAGLVKGLGDIAAQLTKTRSMLSDGQVKVSQAHQSAINAVKIKLEPLVGPEKAQQIAEQSITVPQKSHWKDPASYIDQLVLDAKGIEGLASNLQTKKTRETALGIMQKSLPYGETGPRMGGQAATQEAISAGQNLEDPAISEAVGAAQMGNIDPTTMNAAEAISAGGGTLRGPAKQVAGTLPTPASEQAIVASLEAKRLAAEQKETDRKARLDKEVRDRAEKAESKKRAEVQTNIARSREDLTTAQKSFTDAEAQYEELQSSLDAVDKGESVPGEFYRDPKNNVRYKSAEEMRAELTRREDSLDLAKKARSKAKASIEKWQKEDTVLSKRIEHEIEVEQQAAEERNAKLKEFKSALEAIPADLKSTYNDTITNPQSGGGVATPADAADHIGRVLKSRGVSDEIVSKITKLLAGDKARGIEPVTINQILDKLNMGE